MQSDTSKFMPKKPDPHELRASSARPPHELRVGGSLIRVRIAGFDAFSVEPEIRHRSRMSFRGFGQLESYEYGRFQHQVEAVILRESFEEWVRAEPLKSPPRWEDLTPLAYPGTQPHLDDDDPAFVVARLEIEEHPRITRWRLGLSWGEWLRAIDRDSALVGDVLDQLEPEDAGESPMPTKGGSLFHIRSVAVHPTFMGQAIRRRLIAHTLWTMHRSRGDVAVILVLPHPNPLGDDPRPDQSVAAIRSLTRYYQRIGFARSSRVPMQAGVPVPMHVFFGIEPLRVSGLHEIGIAE
jgi:GNAT superfamily N-acetyltransferase